MRDWFPELPGGWRLARLGALCSLIADGPHFSPIYVDDGYLFLSTRNVRIGGLSLDDVKYVSEDDFLEFCKRVRPIRGDVLYTKGGTTGIALPVDFDEPFQVWVHVAVLRPRTDLVDATFLAAALNVLPCYAQSQLYTRGATNNDLGLTRMVDILVPVAPRDQQSALASSAGAAVAAFAEVEEAFARSISLLEEYKRSLITAAVTGEVDVSTARTQVPAWTGVHQEVAFEASIEADLLATGWEKLEPSSYGRRLGLVPDELVTFLEVSQPKEWAESASG